MLEVTGTMHPETRPWADALADVIVRHPNRAVTPLMRLQDGHVPVLSFVLESNQCSNDDSVISPFPITDVHLCFFPGVHAARAWVAAAWACFAHHEAMELVTVGDLRTRVLDPHDPGSRFDHMFNVAFPRRLTPESLLAALATAIPRDDAARLLEESLR